MRVIHLARKPLSGTVASNVLKHKAGGLDIDGCRIGSDVGTSSAGRWPANLILQHLDSCVCQGTKKIPGNRIDTRPEGDAGREDKSEWRFRPTAATKRGFSDESGQEEAPDWMCSEECPVADLDVQSGLTKSGFRDNTNNAPYVGPTGWKGTNVGGVYEPSTGGASRYFKQVAGRKELIRYLQTLISPPKTETSPWASVWDAWPVFPEVQESHSQVGVILDGFVPTAAQTADLYRILYPGGHVCLIAPNGQMTGYTGAIRLEDAGFEIRDAILVVEKAGKLCYTAKAARSEREAGCGALAKGRWEESRDPEAPGSNNPRNRSGADNMRGNSHPTVKPVEVMARLLEDVPLEDSVVDPFMGSGTTGVACIEMGHSFTGIEQNPEYIPISDARVRHANNERPICQAPATIISDVDSSPKEDAIMSLEDLFGLQED